MLEPFQLQFVQRGIVEVLLLSVGAGLLGTWIVLRGLAFYTHAVGSAAFPGLVLADGLGFGAPLGAFGAAILFAGSLERLGRTRRSSQDSLTALVLVGTLALGVILASDVFHSGANVETLLFGSLLLIGPRDVALAAAGSALALAATLSVGRTWLATGFDPEGARSLGLRSPFPDALLLLLVALVVVAALSAVGALLATSLIVVPAATVRLWTHRMAPWQMGSVLLTAALGVGGLWLSVKTDAPPGATIAVLAGAAFALSALARGARRWRATAGAASVAVAVAMAVAGASLLGGCGSVSATSGGKIVVVATTTQIGDWARQVGGSSVTVHQILKPNTDPHEYEPRPSDVQATAGATLVLENGDRLDEWAGDLVSKAGGSPKVIDLGARVPVKRPGESSGAEASRYDAHWWHDPRNAEAAVGAIRDALVAADPRRAAQLDRNAKAYLASLRSLDRQIGECLSKVPRAERTLVTDHDAFRYFSNRYGIRIVGAVIPSQTTQGQASAKDVARLVRLIEAENVRAVFPESSISAKLAESIARQSGASATSTLYGDSLGPSGSAGATYLKMEAANAEAMVRGFSGGRVSCTIRT
jgi:zinc/manganese transport system substrate-binding protein